MRVNEAIEEHLKIIAEVKEKFESEIYEIGEVCSNALKNGNTIFFMGNGGSAADSQHLAAEIVGRFVKERKGYPAVAFTTDSSIITAIGNDYGFENIFKRQVEALVKPDDVVFGISTSGNSSNINNAVKLAAEMGARTIAFSGKGGGQLSKLCDICITVPAEKSARIQECHIMIGHIICEIIDEDLCND